MDTMPLHSVADQLDDTSPDLAHVLACVREALVTACGSQKAAALTLHVDAPRLSRMLAGTESLPVSLLAREPEVMRIFVGAVAAHYGFIVRPLDARERRQARIAALHEELGRLMAEEQQDIKARAFARELAR